jgi:hypothetical protein
VIPSENTVLDVALELHEDVVDSHWPEKKSGSADMSTTTSCVPAVGVGTLVNALRVVVALLVGEPVFEPGENVQQRNSNARGADLWYWMLSSLHRQDSSPLRHLPRSELVQWSILLFAYNYCITRETA